MNYGIKASPLSNSIIADVAQQLRKILGYTSSESIDIVTVLEQLDILIPSFNYDIRLKEDMRVDAHGYSESEKDSNTVIIREDAYENARVGKGRDRFTIAHEIGHAILHNMGLIPLSRTYPGEKIKTYEGIEWQADAFAGEFLCPAFVIKNMSINQIVSKYGVSEACARAQKKKSLNW